MTKHAVNLYLALSWLLLLAVCAGGCAPEPEPEEAPPADTGDVERGCGRTRCVSVTEQCYGGPGLVCTCTTVTCRSRCRVTVVEGEPVCVEPVAIPLGAP